MKSYLLTIWAVLALAGSLSTASFASQQSIFSNTLRNGWTCTGTAQFDTAVAHPALTGHSISVTADAGQSILLSHADTQTAPYSAITVWVNGGVSGGQHFSIAAVRSGTPGPAIEVGPLPAHLWYEVTVSLKRLGAANASDLEGFSFTNTTSANEPTFYLDWTLLRSFLPSAPAGLTATPQWAAHCPKCGGMAMAHIQLAWNTVPNALSYTVYRNGDKIQDSLAAPAWTDMTVTSGDSYTYTATATGTQGESSPSAPATATAPFAPGSPGSALTSPTNLSVQGSLLSGGCTDVLSWTPVAGAASYNIYQYGTLIGSATSPTYTVPLAIYNSGMTYAVTAVDASGMESLPSGLAGAMLTFDSATVPIWVSSVAPAVPTNVVTTPEWNNGASRVLVTWYGGNGSANTYNVYRDGTLVCQGIWDLYYLDSAVQPGETHTYAISAVNNFWPGTLESGRTSAVSAQALSAAPAPLGVKVQITKVVPNDDSAVVFFNEIPGVTDYRIYDVLNPGKVKYAGVRAYKTQGLGGPYTPIPISIEWNGLDPVSGSDLVVEAVDKCGPFQTMDGMAGPGAMQMDGTMRQAINGQGDPSNMPIVLAASDSFHVNPAPTVLSGSQAFFDNFRGEKPLTTLPMPAPDPRGSNYGVPFCYLAQGNDKWTVTQYGTDLSDSKVFFMGNHLMDTEFDGGGAGSNSPLHNNNSSLVFQPKATADISGGKVLHVTFEVDAHFDGRRWCDLFVSPAGDTLFNPAKFDESDGGNNKATASTKMLRWVIKNSHDISMYDSGVKTDLVQSANWADGNSLARIGWDGAALSNGTTQDLDKRHRFDLYLSQTHYRIMETSPDGTYNIVRDKDFPAGASLPFSQCQVYFVHEVYHTSNDRPELEEYYPLEPYWVNYRPYSDERHWDNMGQEVLDAFPALP